MKHPDITIRVNFTIPESLYQAMKTSIPKRQRSQIVANLLKKEIEQRERALYEIAKAVEQDANLNKEMTEWDETLTDGLDDSEWK